MKRKATTLLLALLGAAAVHASTIDIVGFGPHETANVVIEGFYTGPVIAGVINLSLDGGAPFSAFCIDPFHYALDHSAGFSFQPLIPYLDSVTAWQVRAAFQLGDPSTPEGAAAEQLAIWEIVGGDRFTVIGNDFGAAELLTDIGSYHGSVPNLRALVGPGQDYGTVPETGSTLVMFATGLLALLGFAPRRVAVRS